MQACALTVAQFDEKGHQRGEVVLGTHLAILQSCQACFPSGALPWPPASRAPLQRPLISPLKEHLFKEGFPGSATT